MKKNWIAIFEIIALGALLLAPMSLLALDNHLLFPYITSKAFVWRACVGILFTSWISLMLLDPRYRISLRHPLILSFGLFMIAMLVANIFGVDPYKSFWSNAERMDGYIGLLHLFAYFTASLGFFIGQRGSATSIVPNISWLVLIFIFIGSNYNRIFESIVGEHAALWILPTIVLMITIFAPSFDKPKLVKTIFHGLLSLGVFLGVVALFQDKSRVDSILGNPIYLASFSSFAIFISLYYMTIKEQLFGHPLVRPAIYTGSIIFFLLIIFETGTRGAVLGLVFGGLAASILAAVTIRDTRDRYWRYAGVISVVSILVITTLFFTFKGEIAQSNAISDGNLLKRAAHFSLEDKTTKHRLANWEQAVEGFKERPLTGWGQENYLPVFSKYYQADKLYDGEQWFDRTHNMFLDWLVFGGILGLTAFLLLLATALWIIWKRTSNTLTNTQRSILSGLIVAYMAQNFVAFDALATGIWIAVVLSYLAYISYNECSKSQLIPFELRKSVMIFALLGIWVSLGWWMHYSIIEPRSSSYNFMQILRPISPSADKDTVLNNRYELIENAVNARTLFTQEYIEQLLNNKSIYLGSDVSEEVRRKYVILVAGTAQELIEQHPASTRLPLFYGTFLMETQNYEQAQVYLEEAHEQSPDKIQILWLLGQNASALGDNTKALEYFEKAAKIAPQYQKAQSMYQDAQEAVELNE